MITSMGQGRPRPDARSDPSVSCGSRVGSGRDPTPLGKAGGRRNGMHARVSTAEVQPGRMDEVVAISRDSVLPAARQQRGFGGGLWLTDPDANKVVVATLWGSREDMESGEQSGYYREQIGKLSDLLAGDVVREAYEVSIRE
jgi:heme-degrading monooxygenase HmoA